LSFRMALIGDANPRQYVDLYELFALAIPLEPSGSVLQFRHKPCRRHGRHPPAVLA
jgi:hypothetical protein